MISNKYAIETPLPNLRNLKKNYNKILSKWERGRFEVRCERNDFISKIWVNVVVGKSIIYY